MILSLEYREVLLPFLLLTRLGGLMTFLPGFGEVYISPRFRLLLVLSLTVVLCPLITASLDTSLPNTPLLSLNSTHLLCWVARELMIGVALGLLARILCSALHLTAQLIAFQTSLSSASIFNPALGTQDSAFSGYFMLAATTLLFMADVPYLMIKALIDSYSVFPLTFSITPWKELQTGSFLEEIFDLKTLLFLAISHGFHLGVQLATPFFMGGLLINLLSGLLSRLVPQIQVFFLSMPLQIGCGFVMLVFLTTSLLTEFTRDFIDFLTNIPSLESLR